MSDDEQDDYLDRLEEIFDEVDPYRLRETPTRETVDPLLEAFSEFNSGLFDNKLPECYVKTESRDKRSHGHYAPERMTRTNGNGYTVGIIALNPLYFAEQHGGTIEALQTLLHEMCHHWQFHFGKRSRSGYHNRELADKMKSVGLQPSNTGKPGGKEVGQNMADYPIAGGRFEQIAKGMIEAGFTIPWAEQSNEGKPTVPVRVGYRCPECRLNVLGKRGIRTLQCDCTGEPLRLEETTEAKAEPSTLCIAQNITWEAA
jgi:predicted SprT family Zn-dependent metalloprotease